MGRSGVDVGESTTAARPNARPPGRPATAVHDNILVQLAMYKTIILF